MHKPREDTLRNALEWLAAECWTMGLPVGEIKVGLDCDGGFEVEYGDTERGGLYMCHHETFGAIPQAISANMRRVREKYVAPTPQPRVHEPRPRTHPGTSPSFSRKVIRRDGACLVCQSQDGLHAHHILPRATHPHLSRNPDNGITLCGRCHGKVKGREGEHAEFFKGLLQQTATATEA